MPSPLEALRHEATSLYRLIDFVAAHLSEQENSRTYLDSTKGFFEYIRQSVEKTKRDLNRILRNAEARPNRIEGLYRPAVAIFAGRWTTAQTFEVLAKKLWLAPGDCVTEYFTLRSNVGRRGVDADAA
jgi:hypothetical protein